MNTSKNWFAVLLTLAGIGGILLLLAGGGAVIFFLNFDTQYAPGYSERNFKSIRLGDAEQQVVALLGQPFGIEPTTPYVAWIYSADRQRRFAQSGEGSGTYTTIRFHTNGCVVAVTGAVQTSVSTFEFGNGRNYLKLTEAQIKKLTGSSQAEVQKQFGPPTAIYEDKTSKFLRYSKSPTSANYHLRAIGVDPAGKVVKIWREIYWD